MAAKKLTTTGKSGPQAKPTPKGSSKPSKATAKPAKAATAVKRASAPKPTSAKTAKAAATAKPVKATPSAKSTALAKPVKAAKPVKTAPTPTSASNGALLDAGTKAPSFELTDASGASVSSSTLAGKPYLLYFYPKDDTPGCTKEACDIRDNFGRFGKQGLRVLGVSPDSQQSHAKFGKKYGLPFTLLSDPDKRLASAYGVWGEKNNYGKKYMGIIRSSFLIGADGIVKKVYRGVKVNGHVDAVLTDAQTVL
jgi:thioredoxin-dependent peroxiredoxin